MMILVAVFSRCKQTHKGNGVSLRPNGRSRFPPNGRCKPKRYARFGRASASASNSELKKRGSRAVARRDKISRTPALPLLLFLSISLALSQRQVHVERDSHHCERSPFVGTNGAVAMHSSGGTKVVT